MDGSAYNPNGPVASADVLQAAQAIVDEIRSGAYPFWWPEAAKGLQVAPFDYIQEWLPILASASDPKNIAINGDSAFFIMETMLVETATDNTTFLAQRPLTAQIRDGGSGRYLSNGPVAVDNYFGTAQRPKAWSGEGKVPYIVSPNSTLIIELKNLEAVDRNVRMTFHGIKVFGYKPTQQSAG